MDPFPRDPVVWADHPGYGCNLPALYSAHWYPNPELGFRELRCTDDTSLRHRAGVRWRAPVSIASLKLSWPEAYIPAIFRVYVLRDGAEVPLELGDTKGEPELDIPVGGAPIEGVVIEQPPGSGSAAHPGVMRIRGLAVIPQAEAWPRTHLISDTGQRYPTHMALASDGDPWTCLELSDAAEIELQLPEPTLIAAVSLDIVRIGGLGTPASLHAWLSRQGLLRLPGDTPDDWIVHKGPKYIDTTQGGVVAGTVRVIIGLDNPATTDRVRIQMPLANGGLMAATKIKPLAPPIFQRIPSTITPITPDDGRRGGSPCPPADPPCPPADPPCPPADPPCPPVCAPPCPPVGDVPPPGGPAPLRFSASLGIPDTETRAGVDPQGGVMIQPGASAPHADSHAQCLHLRAQVDVEPTGPLHRRTLQSAPALELIRDHGALSLSQRLFVAPSTQGSPALEWWLSFENTGDTALRTTLRVGLALRDYLWALPAKLMASAGGGELVLRWPDGSVVVQAQGAWRLNIPEDPRGEWVLEAEIEVDAGQTATRVLVCPLERVTEAPMASGAVSADGLGRLEAVTQGFLDDVIEVQLPDPVWESRLRGLLMQSSLFAQAEGQVRYGIFPSVYHGDVFGLEEDWLFYGWAQWGMGSRALRSFVATYLNETHLDKGHYLHDLRNGLTPWQAERLLKMQGLSWREALDEGALGLLASLGAWTVAQRRSTQGVADENEGGWRVFPGLLPAYRYGGDLGFETQSLSANVANHVGLRALADAGIFEASWAEEVADYRAAILEAFEGVKRPGPFYPMHTGGGDPGSYYQLFAAGILEPMDFFAPDDPRPSAMDAAMESQDRLFSGLPRFDDWGSPGPGLDAHYGVGYLLRALQTGRREVFREGLEGLFEHASDPEVGTFREVSPLQTEGASWDHDVMIPGRRMGRSDPCVGGVGVALMLLRSALVTELAGEDGRLGRRLRFLAGVWPEWWAGGRPLVLREAPTFGGAVSLRVERFDEDTLAVELDAPDAEQIELCVPILPGRSLDRVESSGEPLEIDERGIVVLRPGYHELRITCR